MKVSNKIHRPFAIIGAILLLLTTFYNIYNSISLGIQTGNFGNTAYLASVIPNMVLDLSVTILFAVVLFRGIKDKTAGVLVIVSMAIAVLSDVISRVLGTFSMVVSWRASGYAAYLYYIIGSLFFLISALVAIGFRAVITVECFQPGKISAGKAKILLIVLPLAAAVIKMVGTTVQQIGNLWGFPGFEILLSILLTAIFTAVLEAIWVLVGLAFGTAVMEPIPNAYMHNQQNSMNSYSRNQQNSMNSYPQNHQNSLNR